MSNRQISIARILLIISIIIGIGIGIKIGIVSAHELTPAEHVHAKVHAQPVFELHGQTVLGRAVLHPEHLKTRVAHDGQAVQLHVVHLQNVNAA